MLQQKYFIIDFDSTFIRVEALDLLGEIALVGDDQRNEKLDRIREITNAGMEGKLTLRASLEKRLDLIDAEKKHIHMLTARLKEEISDSFRNNKQFLNDHADSIYLVSNGFKDYIVPIVTEFGIPPENIYANTFFYDESGKITGFDKSNVLSSNNGKVEVLRSLKLIGDVYVVGDGYTDYEIRESGLANKFYAFTENVRRDSIAEKADHVAPSLDEFLYDNKLRASISYPKNRINVLLLENVHPAAKELLEQEGYTVELHTAAMDEDELCRAIKNVSVLGIRSKTQVTSKVLESANRLMAIGAFCIGTNQVDLQASLRKGVAVFNAPFSNTRSVVELAIGEIILLMRNIVDKLGAMHDGKWDKSARSSYEIRGKNLGIVGYGNIGSQLSILAEALGMNVYYYDLVEKLALGNARKCNTLDELLGTCDVVSLHVDGRQENLHLIGEAQFRVMKKGVVFLNLSRGHVVDMKALRKYVENGKVAGVGVDVFPEEPKSNDDIFQSELRNLGNVILTPHVGGSTSEAQENIGRFVPSKIIDYINTGSTANSVNFPELQLTPVQNAHRLIHIHKNVPGVLATINQVLARHNLNILGQYLKTNEEIGYLILAVDKQYDDEVIAALKNIKHTIRFRVLY